MCRSDCPLAALVRAPLMHTEKGEVVNSRRIDIGLKVIRADRPAALVGLFGNFKKILKRYFDHLSLCLSAL